MFTSADRDREPAIVPAGYAFSIWLVVAAVWSRRRGLRLRRAGPRPSRLDLTFGAFPDPETSGASPRRRGARGSAGS